MRDRLWLGRILTTITPDQTLYPDAGNPHVVGRVGPPDDAADNDRGEPDASDRPWWASVD